MPVEQSPPCLRNDASLAFLPQLGFAEIGQQETGYGALVSLMRKPLAGV